mmetsp:Transcript_9015/g.19459  ORF Transcript_9015/g.19459 Transcript_9015/m.19459 type:complete len:355 (-) Transcript_9015:2077-3141(-)
MQTTTDWNSLRRMCTLRASIVIVVMLSCVVLSTILSKKNFSWTQPYEFIQGLVTDNRTPLKCNTTTRYLCAVADFGRLNNQIFLQSKLAAIAYELNRTLVTYDLISSVYNVTKLEPLYGKVGNRLIVDYDDRICETTKNLCGTVKFIDFEKGEFRDVKDKVGVLKDSNENVLVVRSADIWLRIDREGTSVVVNGEKVDLGEKLVSQLALQDHLQPRVDTYINKKFGNKPFASVHVRWLEGDCTFRGGDKGYCPLNRTTALASIVQKTGRTDLPIFVATDRERKDIDAVYEEAKDYFFDGKCSGLECAVIDFEIISRSNFFVGALASTAAIIQDKRRKHRYENGQIDPYWESDLA